MAETFKFELVSPERLLLSEEALEVLVPGTEGDFCVLAKHAAVMSTLRPGMIVAKLADGSSKSYFVRGGFADVSVSGFTLLAEYAVVADDFDMAAMDEQLQTAQDAVDRADGVANVEKAQDLVNRLNEVKATMTA